MQVLNYVYFLIITLLGYYYLFSRGKVLREPLDPSRKIRLSGPEMFWVLTFSTGLLAFSASAGVDLMAVRLLVLEVFCILGILTCKTRPVLSAGVLLYGLYLGWLAVGLLYSPSAVYGGRVILKYAYPFLILLFASAVVRDREVFLKAGLGARIVGAVSIVFFAVPFAYYLIPGVFWYGTACAINYISLCMFSLALFFHEGRQRKNLYWAAFFLAPCVVWIFRTSILGSLVALMTFAFFRYRLKSLPAIAGIMVMGLAAVFLIPSVKAKMFKDDNVTFTQLWEGKISTDSIESNARFAMWDFFLAKYHEGHELAGSGTGALQQYFYTHNVFGGLRVIHNDYVQILCDNGLIGFWLYVIMILAITGHCFREYGRRSNSNIVRMCALVAGSSLMGVAATLYSDNVVNYSMATLGYPFGFYGMMLGLKRGQLTDTDRTV